MEGIMNMAKLATSLTVALVMTGWIAVTTTALSQTTNEEIPSPLKQENGGQDSASLLMGRIVKMEGESWVIKEDEGSEVSIRLGSDTTKKGILKVGEQIIATVRPDGTTEIITGPEPIQISGMLIEIQNDEYLVQEKDGTNVKVLIAADTDMEVIPRVGDRLFISMSPDGHALEVKGTGAANRNAKGTSLGPR